VKPVDWFTQSPQRTQRKTTYSLIFACFANSTWKIPNQLIRYTTKWRND